MSILCRRAALPVLVLILVAASGTARADGPFQMEPSSWMSFERYKEKPSNWLAPDEREKAVLAPVVVPPPITPSDMPVITAPTRPIATPVLPGLNREFDVHVNTTEDDKWVPPINISHPEIQPDFDMDRKRWLDAAKVARMHQDKKQILDNSTDRPAYDLRFSYLPARITPMKKITAPAKQTEVAQPKPAQPAPPPPPAAVQQTPALDPAACAALEAYKKRQLEAIESDRATLTALQNAISEMGLNKELDFLTGTSGSLKAGASANANKSPAPQTP